MKARVAFPRDEPTLYREDPDHRIQGGYLATEVYAAAITSFVISCTDTIIVNWQSKTIFLAKRAVLPMKGLWIIGGRRLAGETRIESMFRCFKRETGLVIDTARFQYVRCNEYMWRDREQEPQNVGSHNEAHTFALELTKEERTTAAAKLDRKEYVPGFGLREFSRKELIKNEVHPAIVDLYDAIFG